MTHVPSQPAPLTQQQIDLWADRIATDQDTFPGALNESDQQRLSTAVRQRLRHRLLRFLAKAIANRIETFQQSPKGPSS